MPSHPSRLTARMLPTALALALASPAAFADPPSTIGATSDVDAKLGALTAKLDAQQEEIARLRAQVEELQLQQMRGRGLTGEAARNRPPRRRPSTPHASHARSPHHRRRRTTCRSDRRSAMPTSSVVSR